MIGRLSLLARRLSPLAMAVGLTACVAERPAPIGRDDYGAGFTRSVAWAEGGSLLSACAAGGVARAERAIADWVEVVAHIDTCRVGAARYYTDPEFEGDLIARLSEVAAVDGSDACRGQTRAAAGHIRSIDRTIQGFARRAPELCGVSDEFAVADRHRQAIAAQIGQMTTDIRRFHTLR